MLTSFVMCAIAFPQGRVALVVIDLLQASSFILQLEANVGQWIAAFRQASLPIVHVHHHDKAPGSSFSPETSPTGVLPQTYVTPLPHEPVVIKHVTSGFIGTNWEKLLRSNQWDVLVVVGMSTVHCVSTSIRAASNLGFQVYVPHNACATFNRAAAPGSKVPTSFDADTMQAVALAELHDEFATVVSTESVLKALRS